MNKLTFDHIFKIGLLILGFLFIFELHSYVKNGRYKDLPNLIILDTQTGLLYDDFGPRGAPGQFVDNPKKK